MNSAAAARLRLLASAVSLLVLLAAAGSGWCYWQLRRSLPVITGKLVLPGLGAGARIERDAQGVPVIHAANRTDLARVTGFAHAQDRFFQMDLLRRRAAGELAELLGKTAVPFDRAVRPHRFRRLARTVLADATPEERGLLDAYAAGVNAGLAALRQRPWEYLVLRTDPAPWTAEDSVLVLYALTLDLQEGTLRHQQTLSVIFDQLGLAALNFFAPEGSEWDAALDGSTLPPAPVPSPREIDLRQRDAADAEALPPTAPALREDDFFAGGSSFALSGGLTATGAPLLANEVQLGLAVPNYWYRASLAWGTAPPGSGAAPAAASPHRVTGITLPGLPVVFAGSNGRIAWGFTNACIASCDLLVCELDSKEKELYHTPGGWQVFRSESETIKVRDGDPVVLEWHGTIWGPVAGKNRDGKPLVRRWTADDPAATNLGFFALETADDVPAALAVAQHAGLPPQNFLVVDAGGAMAWTIAGRIPRRLGYTGRLPVTWAYGDRRWDGYLAPGEVPVVLIPPGPSATALAQGGGRLWAAGQRMLGDAAYAKLGDGGYALGARAGQIRDGLLRLAHARPADLLAVQRDDRAPVLERWRKLLLSVLTPAATAGHEKRAELRALAAAWDGRAAPGSAGGRGVRAFRAHTADRVLDPIFESCHEADESFARPRTAEGPLWTLLQQKPAHLLDSRYRTWDQLLLAAADDVIADADKDGVALAHQGVEIPPRIRHPFSHFLSGPLSRLLDLPNRPLPSDANPPRPPQAGIGTTVQWVVAPGHEAEGICSMPGGASGHPLSPFYRAGHEAWVRGDATPFLPGPAKYTLELMP